MISKLLFVVMVAGAGQAAVAQTPAAAFGARQSVQDASLSPDGRTMAFLAPMPGRGNALYTVSVDADASPRRALVASGDPERLAGCGWVANDRLVCNVYSLRRESGYLIGVSRMVGVDAAGGNVKLVSQRDSDNAWYFNRFGGNIVDWLPGQDGALLMGRWYVPESKAGSLIAQRREGYGVDRVDTRTLRTKRVVSPMINADEFISDGQGRVRIAGINRISGDYTITGVKRYMFRRTGSDDWQELGDYDTRTEEGFNPYAIDPVADVVYGLRKSNGRKALYKRSLNGSANAETLVFAHPEVDVDGLMRLGRKGRIIGATFATDRRQAHYFDPAMAALADSLSKALPGAPLINFEGASDDEQKLLIWAGSDVDPGRYYLLDRATKQMRPLLLTRPELENMKLAEVKSIRVRASDGTMIPAYLTLPPGSSGKNLPALVMPHGGPSARDEWGFDWLPQYFANRGYAVLQPNYRGSSGYGDAWFQNNGFRSWRTAVGDVADSGRWLVSEGIADPNKLAIFGWSYGGYAALQSGVVAPDLFKAIVAVAPVTDLLELKGQYTRSSARSVIRDFVGTGPHVREGSPAQNAAAIQSPVLLFHGDLDQNVEVSASRLMADRLRDAGKKHQLVIYPGLAHSLEDASARTDMLAKSDAFLRGNLGM